MTRAKRFIEEHGNSCETECMSCKRRGDRVIYWSHNDCHVCEDRRAQAEDIRRQRKYDRMKSRLNSSNQVLYNIFKDLGAYYRMGSALGGVK